MTEKYLKIENETSLSKSIESGAIINTDKAAYEKYLNIRDRKTLELTRLDKLEDELSEIKQLLLKLLSK